MRTARHSSRSASVQPCRGFKLCRRTDVRSPGPHSELARPRASARLRCPESRRTSRQDCCFCFPLIIPGTMNAQATRTLLKKQLLAEGRRASRNVGREQFRCFSCSVRNGQQPPQHSTPPPKSSTTSQGTTHFGFETIDEALKEQKGTPILCCAIGLELCS